MDAGVKGSPPTGTVPAPVKPAAIGLQDSWTLFLLYAICIFDGVDTQLLSSAFHALEETIGLGPAQLASLSFAQAVVNSAMTPFWGVVLDSGVAVKKVLCGGTFVWALTALGMAGASSFWPLLALKSINGLALSALTPVSQVVICSLAPVEQRGWYFGLAQFAHQAGAILCCISVTNVADRSLELALPFAGALHVDGWRVAFASVAGICFLMWTLLLFSKMDVDHHREHEQIPLTAEMVLCRPFMLLGKFWRIDTFKIIILQGLFGCIPWSALAFATMYYQYSGFTDMQASLIVAALGVGGGLGGVLGGEVSDRLARWSPCHGRALAAQISVLGCLPLVLLSFGGGVEPLPFVAVCCTMLCFGLIGSWCAAGVNRPILAEIVPREHWSTIFSWTRAIDGSFAAVFGAPLVGLLVERCFGYVPSRLSIELMPEALREANAVALSKAMLCCTVLPFAVCAFFYSLLHLTYARDLAEARGERRSLTSPPSA